MQSTAFQSPTNAVGCAAVRGRQPRLQPHTRDPTPDPALMVTPTRRLMMKGRTLQTMPVAPQLTCTLSLQDRERVQVNRLQGVAAQDQRLLSFSLRFQRVC